MGKQNRKNGTNINQTNHQIQLILQKHAKPKRKNIKRNPPTNVRKKPTNEHNRITNNINNSKNAIIKQILPRKQRRNYRRKSRKVHNRAMQKPKYKPK